MRIIHLDKKKNEEANQKKIIRIVNSLMEVGEINMRMEEQNRDKTKIITKDKRCYKKA